MQDALDCMKKDGTIAKLSEKWFGRKPGEDDARRVVITPGYGVPGMPGYDPTPHELQVRLTSQRCRPSSTRAASTSISAPFTS